MSEYDYSPEAIERHLATQQRIERWVDKTLEQSPANPFESASLPSEDSTTTARVQTPYPQSHPLPLPPQLQPQPAFYATPQGIISPTYSNLHGHGHSQRYSPSPRPLMIPQGYRPVMSRSFSTPPHPVRNFYPLPSAPYTPYPNSSPLNPSPYSSPYSSPYNSPYRQPSPMPHSSQSQTSFHSVPSSQIYVNPNPVPLQHPYPYFQPSPPRPVQVVIRGNSDYVVVAPSGHHVQVINPDSAYETQIRNVNPGQYTFSKLKIKSSKSKKSRRSRRDSF